MGRLIRGCQRVLVFDTVMQYGQGPRQNRLPGFLIFTQPGELVSYWRRYRGGRFRILYQPGYYADEHFNSVARLVAEVRDTVFAIDEVWHFCKPSWTPEALRFLLRCGRHRGVSVIYTAQRPANLSGDIRSLSTQMRVFRLQEELDLAALRGRLPSPALNQVPSLPDRSHIWRDEFNNWKLVRG